jgi:hypothetical protein
LRILYINLYENNVYENQVVALRMNQSDAFNLNLKIFQPKLIPI